MVIHTRYNTDKEITTQQKAQKKHQVISVDVRGALAEPTSFMGSDCTIVLIYAN